MDSASTSFDEQRFSSLLTSGNHISARPVNLLEVSGLVVKPFLFATNALRFPITCDRTDQVSSFTVVAYKFKQSLPTSYGIFQFPSATFIHRFSRSYSSPYIYGASLFAALNLDTLEKSRTFAEPWV